MEQPDFSHLLISLNNSRIATENNALYQTIKGLIDSIGQSQRDFLIRLGVIPSSSGGGGGGGLANLTYLTINNEQATAPNSKQLLAGTGITFTDTAVSRTISSSAISQDHVVMSDGANPAEPMNDGNGNFIYIPYIP